MPEIVATDANNGETLVLSSGDTLLVRLPENPGTGYRWEIEDKGSLRLLSSNYSAGLGLGAVGERSVRFAASVPGSTAVALALRRSWERQAAPQAQFRLTVIVT